MEFLNKSKYYTIDKQISNMEDKNNTNKHNYFMSLALKEAKKGFGNTIPNPLVGALIVKDNIVLAKSYHKEFGKNHAEINALDKINPKICHSNLNP